MKITRYMAIKWTKAAFEIVIAIIIIVFGNKILFGVFPTEATEKSTFQLLVALLWFLVIWCIIVAVRNIILSLRPEPKNSLVTLNEKIDALDRKLVSMGLASETIPEAAPPSPEELKKGRNKKIMVAAGIVAAIIVLAAISIVFLFPMMGGGGNPSGGSTPEDTLNALITAMNSKDANGVLSLTVYSFGNASMKSQFRQGLNDIFNQGGGAFHVTMNSHQVKNLTDLNASESSDLTSIKNEIQSRISSTITAYCMIVFNMTITVNQSSFYESGNMPCFQIDGGWYILLDFGDGGPGDGGGNQQNAEQTFNGFIESLNERNGSEAVSFTVTKFGNGMERNQAEMNFSSMWQNSMSFNVGVNSHQVLEWSSLSPSQQSNLSNILGNVSSHFGVTITESCFIQYSITISNDSGSKQMVGYMPCFKIDNLWYLMMEENGGGQPDYTIAASWSHPGSFYILTIDSITGLGPTINANDVYLTVKYVNTTLAIDKMQLSMMPIGTPVNGTEFVEVSGPGTLDTGDYFSLDDTMFGPGAQLILENAMGTQVYLQTTI